MRPGRVLILVLLLLLLVLAAVALAAAGPTGRAAAVSASAALGGAARAGARRGGQKAEAGPPPAPTALRHAPPGAHPIGHALERYAQALGPADAIGVHPLDRGRYEGPVVGGARGLVGRRAPGKALPAGASRAAAAKPWTAYETWEDLARDEGATAEYLRQRAAVIDDPDLDWGPVLRVVTPLLAESREYIGLINLEPDGRTLRLEAHEASPVEAGTLGEEANFAAVPGDLVERYARRPALFLFHTHPADPRANPLPSSHDLSTAIYFAAVARFAANVLISRYGAFVYGLDWAGYRAVNEAKDWKLAMLNLSHDVVAAHEAVRSWSAHTLAEYLAFYARHRLFVFAFPTSEMVAAGRRLTLLWDLESPIDHAVIAEHGEDVRAHVAAAKAAGPAERDVQARRAPLGPAPAEAADLGLD